MKINTFLSLLFTLSSTFIFGQWHSLPYSSGYFGNSSNYSLASGISISSNFTIFSGKNHYKSSPYTQWSISVDKSIDDLSSSSQIFSDISAFDVIYSLHATNDTTCQIVYSHGLYLYKHNSPSIHICNFTSYPKLFFAGIKNSYSLSFNSDSINIFKIDINAQTIQQKSVLHGLLNHKFSMIFTNDSTGYLSGSDNSLNFIKKTNDYGTTWSNVLLCNDSLNAICFPTKNVGYVVGDSGTIYKTINAGVNWNKLNFPVNNRNLLSVNFISIDTGYVGGNIGTLYSTKNGGLTWISENSTILSDIKIVKMVDDSTAYFVIDTNHVYKNNYNNFTGIKTITELNHINIYPNPTISILNITDEQNEFKNSIIEIKNPLGQVVFNKLFTNQIDVSSLPSGMYFLAIHDNSNSKIIKIIKQ